MEYPELGSSKHLQNRYVACIHKSPLLFTAPHSKAVYRDKQHKGKERQIHKRELFAGYLACDFGLNTGKNSFIFWGDQELKQQDLDPNYLRRQNFPLSPFHQALQYWAFLSQQLPLFHIDVHGKMDRQQNCEIDVGIKSMEKHLKGDSLISKLIDFFDQNGNIFGQLRFKDHECKFNLRTSLFKGYWGGEVHTMTQQAIMMGIPSFQMEIPFSVRKQLSIDNQLRNKFQDLFNKLHETVIVPYYESTKRKFILDEELAKNFISTVGEGQEVYEAYAQIIKMQIKQEE